ncbi:MULTISPECIES: DMT family transporter [Comamonas]|uniref:DMT family transporter n=1 Tax=Comamonas TaxID=283 RepID=UPI0015F97572|nr:MULTISPECIES: DMT family transporter [Comamonas]UUC94786.1 DMT family transporter [Comamonas sp. C11]WEE78825.1 DMT family transporter [Comamonas testosteroni]
MNSRSSLISGLGFALAACALWGAIFLVPAMLPEFSPLQITFGRFVLYGVVALCVFLPRATRLLPRLQAADIRHLVWLALTGNVVYFALVATAVQWIGMAVTSLIVGLVPVTVPLLGRNTSGALPLRRMLAPMALILAGIVLVNVHALSTGSEGSQGRYLLGVLMAVLAMLCWSRYALDNTRYLAQSRFNGTEWSTLWGLVVGLISALLWALLWLISPEASGAGSPDIAAQRWQLFWLLNLAVAILSSWLGNWMWNAASQRLPITFVGQLLVFETLFALAYHFLYEQRLPRIGELTPMLLILAGLVWSLRRFQAASRAAASV